jgi:hypothetical protein
MGAHVVGETEDDYRECEMDMLTWGASARLKGLCDICTICTPFKRLALGTRIKP